MLVSRLSALEGHYAVLLTGVFNIAMSISAGCFPAYLCLMTFSAFCISLFQIKTITRLQKQPESAGLGRVFARMEMLSNIFLPLGMVLWGWFGDVLSVTSALLAAGTGLLLLTLIQQ